MEIIGDRVKVSTLHSIVWNRDERVMEATFAGKRIHFHDLSREDTEWFRDHLGTNDGRDLGWRTACGDVDCEVEYDERTGDLDEQSQRETLSQTDSSSLDVNGPSGGGLTVVSESDGPADA